MSLEQELRDSKEQLRALMAHLQWVREKERAHIAREIHDELGQTLTGLKIDLSWIETRLQKQARTPLIPPLLDRIKSMSSSIDSTIVRVRKISTELRPGILDEFGLVAAIEWQSREFQTRTGIRCRFQSNKDHIALNDDCATAVFRVFQETLTNILRHADGTEVEITLRQHGKLVTLRVRDNGKGISDRKIFDPQSLGILGMRERVLLSNGQFTIKGLSGKGTTVMIELPLKNSNVKKGNRSSPRRKKL